MKKKCILFLMVLFALPIYANNNIELVSFKIDSMIIGGEPAEIAWEFKNAEKVLLDGTVFTFKPKDHLTVYPQVDTEYNFIAIAGEDTLTHSSTIYIMSSDASGVFIPKKKEPAIEFADPLVLEESIDARIPSISNNIENAIDNQFYTGKVVDYNKAKLPLKLKIMSVQENKFIPNNLIFKAIVVDHDNNFVYKLNQYAEFCSFSYKVECGSAENLGFIREYYEATNLQTGKVNNKVIIDNSIFCKNPEGILEAVNQFATINCSNRFGVQLYSFNCKLNYFSKMDYSKKVMRSIAKSKDEFGSKSLCAIYRSCFNVLEMPQDNIETNYTMIVSGKDNASLIYDVNDLVDKANEENICINIIGVGYDIDEYALKYITTKTGGTYYHLDNNEITLVKDILEEIHNSKKHFYKIEVQFHENLPYLCDNAIVTLALTHKDKQSYDQVEYGFVSVPHYSMYQSLAIFKEDSINVAEPYYENIKLIADILNQNSNIAVQLMGHSEQKYNKKEAMAISLKRASKVFKILTDNGVATEQIRFKGVGDSNPVCYLENESWQKELNNRVDLKWLAPSLYPIEIITQSVSSENAALDIVIEWETLGYNAYYERRLDDGIPLYCVKLWGYKDVIEAHQAIQILKQDFELDFVIE